MKKLGIAILELRNKGYSYRDIVTELGCSRSIVPYYCNNTTKKKILERKQNDRTKQHPFKRKIENFISSKRSIKQLKNIIPYKDNRLIYDKIITFNKRGDKIGMITLEEVQAKFGDNTTCYLTGDKIDVTKPRSYHFDHKVPVSKSGDNSIDNLGICTKEANMAKSDLTEDEFVALCKKVLVHHGYKVEKM